MFLYTPGMSAPCPVLSPAQLADLLGAHPLPEAFGPGSPHPALTFRLDQADPHLAPLLATLPCPVIGIGEGPLAPACDIVLPDEARRAPIMARIAHAPITAMVLVQHLRASTTLPLADALAAESMAYAAVQFGPEFRAWLAARPALPTVADDAPPLLVAHDCATLHLTLNRPHHRNAIDTTLRDALCEALDLARIDPHVEKVVLQAAGRCFSIGGDLREFGLSSDPATAHWIRSVRLPARRVLAVADKLEARIHGGAIGAGIELAAFARTVIAAPDAWFQLPEIDYGLIPGAGGTVSIPRRIGRQRAAEMMLSARRIPAPLALEWGLIDAIEPHPGKSR